MKMHLKLKRNHPAKRMFLQKHMITMVFQEFDLNKKELAELESEGGRHWFEVKGKNKK